MKDTEIMSTEQMTAEDESNRTEQTAEPFLIPDMSEEDTEDENLEDMVDIDSLVAKIDAKIAELEREENEFKSVKEIIFQSIKTTLEDHHIKYVCNPAQEWVIEISFSIDNKPFHMQIIFENEKIIVHSVFPFRVQANSLALVCLHMAEFNRNRAFSTMQLDMDSGEISMNYTYLINKADNYNAEHFWTYMLSFIQPSLDTYVRLNRLAVGKVSKTKKEYYKALLEKSLAVLNGEEDEENIIYGDGWVKDFFDRKQALLERLKAVTEHNLPDDTSEKVEEKASSFDQLYKSNPCENKAYYDRHQPHPIGNRINCHVYPCEMVKPAIECCKSNTCSVLTKRLHIHRLNQSCPYCKHCKEYASNQQILLFALFHNSTSFLFWLVFPTTPPYQKV